MNGKWRTLLAVACIGATVEVQAQQYTGMSGLIHVPSADMDAVGDARIGAHFLNKEFTPDAYVCRGKKFHTMSYYLSVTPFSWMEIGYTCSLMRSTRVVHGVEDKEHLGLNRKDRFFSAKLQPLREQNGKWWPSVAVGMNDLYSGRPINELGINPETGLPVSCGNDIFSNYYLATSKHFDWMGNRWGVHLSYRHWRRDPNANCNGVVGGLTFQPVFARNLRFVAEYTGDGVNVGFDWKLWKHLLLQSSLQDGKYFTGGLCFCINLM